MSTATATVKYDLKLYSDPDRAPLDPAELVPVFHRFIQEALLDELLIDVADYSHVPDGPGVVLIGHDAFYALDSTDGRPGLLYSRRRETAPRNQGIAGLEGRLRSIFRSALAACRALESEPALAGRLRFDGRELILRVNDRLATVERRQIEAELRSALAGLLEELYGERFEIRATGDERERVALAISVARSPGVQTLLDRLERLQVN